MSENLDLYDALGITAEERKLQGEEFDKILKKKYKQKALEFHPDRHVNDSAEDQKKAEEQFKTVNYANSILSDPKKRAEYDNPKSGFGGFSDLDSIIKHFYGDFGFGNMWGNGNSRQPKNNHVEGHVRMTLKEMHEGCEKDVIYTIEEECKACHGEGGKTQKCPYCDGSGMIVTRPNQWSVYQRTCDKCFGRGKIIVEKCESCFGSGKNVLKKTIKVSFPKGMRPNTSYQTDIGNNTILHSVIEENQDGKYSCDGDNIYSDMEITLADALLGTTANVTTIDGNVVTVKIPRGVKQGERFCLRGRGMNIFNTNNRGNMYCDVNYDIPKDLTTEEEKLINKLAEMPHFKKNK